MSNNIDWKSMTSDGFGQLVADDETAFSFAVDCGLVDREKICECGSRMTIQKKSAHANGQIFKCTAGKSSCRKTKSILDGSWFSNCKIGVRKALLCVRAYAKEATTKEFSFETGISFPNTIVNWKNYFRATCFEACCKDARKIGGPGLTVQVDESLIFKRKYNVGRISLREAAHEWVVGGVCVESGECFIIPVPNRNMETLANAISQWIYPGSRIVSDSWRGYNNISRSGFQHDSVNHSLNFINPNDPSVNSQKVERMWRTLKSIVPKGTHSDIRFTYFSEFVFKQNNKWFGLTVGERIKLILDTIKIISFSS